MATFKLFLQSKSEQSNIYVSLSLGRGRVYRRKSGYIINPKFWNDAKGEPRTKELRSLKRDLGIFLLKLEKAYNDAIACGEYVDSLWLENTIRGIHNVCTDLLADHIESAIAKKDVSENRLRDYRSFMRLLEKFQKGIVVQAVNKTLLERFQAWQLDREYAKSTINKNMDMLSMFCNIDNLPHLKEMDKDVIYLSPEELTNIKSAYLYSDELENARKWLLFGCAIGQRGGDLLRVEKENIKNINGLTILEVKQEKTGKRVVVPLLSDALDVVENGFPYKITLDEFNGYIKDICRCAGLDQMTYGNKRRENGKGSIYAEFPKWELVSSHICRRSFSTNFYGKIPTPVIIGVTGHSTERMFLKYIGRSSMDNAILMDKWMRQLV